MAYIYKIINDINDKVYIGQTKGTIENRFKSHCYAVKHRNFPLYLAMRKYGIEHFSIQEVEKCNEEDLNDREKFWIKYYDSYNNGYNASLGGDCSNIVKTVSIKMFSNEGELIGCFNSIKECAIFLLEQEKTNFGEHEIKSYLQSISLVARGKRKRFHNFFFTREDGPDKQFYLKTLSQNEDIDIDIVKENKLKRKYTYRNISYCKICNKIITYGHTYCLQCNGLTQRKIEHPTREELKNMIRTMSFKDIGDKFNVSPQSIVKWCKKEKLPYRKKDIKNYSDKEWALL